MLHPSTAWLRWWAVSLLYFDAVYAAFLVPIFVAFRVEVLKPDTWGFVMDTIAGGYGYGDA